MARRTESYVDTSAFIALVDRSDSFNSLFGQLFADPPPLITTTLVLAEGHAWFLKRYDRNRALQFMMMIEEMHFLKLVPTGQPELQAALEMLRRFSDQDLTIVDALGLYTMKERRIKTCWSTDFHLGLTGVALVVHQQ
jgi:predicted nucleic acid-binding protein